MKKLTARWVRKAESDWRAAQSLVSSKPPLSDEAGLHCQQVVEKYFKAILQEAGAPIPKIHNLEMLLGLLPAVQATDLKQFQPHLKALSRFAAEYRYPGITLPHDRPVQHFAGLKKFVGLSAHC